MSYIQYGLVQASDYDTLVGATNDTAANKLNTLWGVGYGSSGYGQTPITSVSVGNTVAASNWASLVNTQANIGAHQGTSITPVAAPSLGQSVTALTALPTNLSTLYGARLNAASQGSTDTLSLTYSSNWSSLVTFTHVIAFANGNAARYFFNSGGQLAVTTSHPAGSGIDAVFNNMAVNMGTVVLSSPNGATINIAGTSYQGVTKVGGGGTSSIAPNAGYYALNNANTTVFTQNAQAGSYVNSFIRLIAVTNNPQTGNGDQGNIITLYTVWDEVPDG